MRITTISPRNTMFAYPMDKEYDLNLGLLLGNVHDFVIDTGVGGGSVQPVLDALKGRNKPLIVVNTHCHWDHIWGNWAFRGATIVSHPLCRALEDKHWDAAYEEYKQAADGEVHKCLPNLVFENELYFPEDGVRLFFAPGHSGDDIHLYDEIDRVLYAGDNIGDTAACIVPYINTDAATFARAIEIFKKYPFEAAISGHNKPQGRDVLARMEAALPECWRRQLEEFGPPEPFEA